MIIISSFEKNAESAWIRPGEREIQELMGTRVKPDAPDYRASRNTVKKHSDNLSGRFSRAKWSCWRKRVLGDEVNRCLEQAWGLDEEWDGVDDQQGKSHRHCTDHATIELTRLASCDLLVRISPMHSLTDQSKEPISTQENTFKSTNPMNRNRNITRAQCAMRNVFLLRML